MRRQSAHIQICLLLCSMRQPCSKYYSSKVRMASWTEVYLTVPQFGGHWTLIPEFAASHLSRLSWDWSRSWAGTRPGCSDWLLQLKNRVLLNMAVSFKVPSWNELLVLMSKMRVIKLSSWKTTASKARNWNLLNSWANAQQFKYRLAR